MWVCALLYDEVIRAHACWIYFQSEPTLHCLLQDDPMHHTTFIRFWGNGYCEEELSRNEKAREKTLFSSLKYYFCVERHRKLVGEWL